MFMRGKNKKRMTGEGLSWQESIEDMYVPFFAFQSEMFMAVVCFVCVGLTWILVIVFLW
jgi:hypothetical protein